MGGSPYDKVGDDTYQLQGWAENSEMTSLQFVVDEGDVEMTLLQFFDRDAESEASEMLHEMKVSRTAQHMFLIPVELLRVKRPRIYLRLVALDGLGQKSL